MDEFEDFESVFHFKPDYIFDHKTVEAILANRRTLEDGLFFDRLLRILGIKQGKLENISQIPTTDNFACS